MHFLKETFGSLATEGSPVEIYLAEVDLGAYGSIGFPAAVPPTLSPLPVAVPLWQLVYHDSVLNYVAEGGYTTERFRISGGDYLAFLALYGLLPTQFDEKELYLSRTMREAYTSEMVRHEYLTPVRDGFRAVAHSLFGDGTEVVANFTDSPFLYEGRETPPHDFILFKRGEK